MNNEYIINALDTTDNSIYDGIIKSNYTYNGFIVPRVTEILSACIHSDSIVRWANSLGFKHMSYTKTLKMYADWGTECHNCIDKFLENEYKTVEYPKALEANNAYKSFLYWFQDISQTNNVYVKMHEQHISCKYFGGTLDGLYDINGRLYLIDYKTTNTITFKHFLQLSAYLYILKTEYGITVDGGILILQLSKTDISYNEWFLNFEIPEHREYIEELIHAFLSIVYSYYNITKVQMKFDDIDWGGDALDD